VFDISNKKYTGRKVTHQEQDLRKILDYLRCQGAKTYHGGDNIQICTNYGNIAGYFPRGIELRLRNEEKSWQQ